ncbi:GntR family transcriptional regulator [Paenibacillus sp. CGMCC 1.16610]|uniref:GntR family transcriptional regulator n=1 Tax=Paenibacillus anseongense TaxID=2682845 RepID=A0ABW9U6P6_9BACL|nr:MULTISPECIES: GntR family transcriptional regulator [Paenibacillus]MBA2942984.1 GntR family transcriptional regulator [Paenibacillus sp. CGMCC 1.16610]MVQ33480.1 GntR family transcriptional regulator [Paenibacillus anseongense]
MNKVPLYRQIYQSIKDKIISGELRPKDRVPSEQEFMDEFRVSKITVKNALAALVDEGLVTRIQGKGTFVSRDPVSVTVETAATRSVPIIPPVHNFNYIGLIIPTMKTKVIQRLVDYVEFYVKEAGYQLVLHITRESSHEESRAVQQLTNTQGVRGIIVFPTEDESYNESLLRLSLDKYPFVFIDRYLRNIDTYRITSDNWGGAYETVDRLLKEGHHRIALISPDNTNTTIEDRTHGFEKAYIDSNIPIDKSLWCHVPIDILRTGDTSAYVAKFLHQHPNLTAVFALTAEMARLTHHALHEEEGLDPNTALVSFDDPEIPGIPHVLQDEEQMALSAVSLLLEQCNGQYTPQRVEIPVRWV